MADKKPKQSKQDVLPFQGGCDVKLDKEIEGGGTLRQSFEQEVGQALDQEIKNHEKLIKKIKKWSKQFRGVKPDKTYPYVGVSNVAIPMTNWLIDTVFVRVIDAIFSQKYVWVLKAKRPELVDAVPQLQDEFDWWVKNIGKLRTKVIDPLLQAGKVGTGLGMIDFESQQRTIYDYATEKELADTGTKKYVAANGSKLVKKPLTIYDGPVFKAISREDWISSADSNDIQDAFICGYKFYLSKAEFERRVDSGFYEIDEDRKNTILGGDKLDEVKQERIKEGHKEVEESDRERVELWQLWVKYDVDNDKEVDDVRIVFHQDTRACLKAIYNPLFYGNRPIIKFIFDPVEYSFDGRGFCEKLEQLQEVEDTLWNQRLDRATQLNIPAWVVRMGSSLQEQLGDDKKIVPGIIYYTEDPESDIKELGWKDTYPDTVRLEALVQQYAQLVMGVSPHVMGQPTTERPVARETLALIQELNKKYKFYIDNLRECFRELGYQLIETWAQYQPRYTRTRAGEEEPIEIRFDQMGYIRDGIEIELAASSEMLNAEIQRQIDLTLYQILTDYSTKLAGMVQVALSPHTPPPFRAFILNVASIGDKLMRRIVRDFGAIDAEMLVPNIKAMEEVIQQIPYIPAPPEQEGTAKPQTSQGQAQGVTSA